MDRLLATRQRVDAAHRSPDIVSRLETSVSRAHTLRKERRLLPIKFSVDPPLRWSTFSLTPSLCALLRYSIVIYSFNLISMASTCC
jgi:hypothetical protein